MDYYNTSVMTLLNLDSYYHIVKKSVISNSLKPTLGRFDTFSYVLH
jgi:hypothetical protein